MTETVEARNYPKVHDTLNSRLQLVGRGHFLTRFFPLPLEVDFENLDETRRQLRSRQPIVPMGKLIWVVDDLRNRGELAGFYSGVIGRIAVETGYFHEYQEVGWFEALQSGLNVDRVNGVAIEWATQSRLRGSGALRIEAGLAKVLFKESPPRIDNILYTLANEYILPNGVLTFAHEFNHYLLYAQNSHKTPELKRCDLELEEVHARRLGEHPLNQVNPDYTVASIKQAKDDDGRPFYPGVSDDKLHYAVRAVDCLNVLGFTPVEIAMILRKSDKWDIRRKIYPDIDKVIRNRQSALRLDPASLRILMVADGVEREIDRVRAKLIVQEKIMSWILDHPQRYKPHPWFRDFYLSNQ